MKILYLAFAELDIPNACRTHVVEVIRNFAELGHQVVGIVPRSSAPIEFPGNVRMSYVSPWSFSVLGRHLFDLLAAVQMCYFFIVYRPDFVYEREMASNPWPALFCRLFRIPLFVELNGIHLDELAQHGANKLRVAYERWLQSWELHTATGLIVSSDLMRTRFIKEYDLPEDRCEFILNGFNPQIYSPGSRQAARVQLGLSEEAFALVFVGCLENTYDYDLLLYFQLLARLKPKCHDLVLWIVGDGFVRKEWERKARSLGLENAITFVGYQPEDKVADWIRASNLCLVPFTEVGLKEKGVLSSTKIWSYAACGRAILLHSDPRQFLTVDLQSLFRCIPPGDEQAIESSIHAAISEPSSLDREGQANAEWAHENATWTHTVKRTLDFIVEQIDEPSQRENFKTKEYLSRRA